ncbi:MAG: maleylpyruvate isomerase N-terminal domain-containing protein [Anaerolineae bacterium]|nr:maleylpyruvate isomerase N-terminal domain-containing protein [Anaerolineae bacterium]
MSQQWNNQLVENITAARSKTLDVLKGIDLTAVAHPDSGWQVRDVVGHLTAWDYEAAASLRAYVAGKPYQIQTDPEAFNQQAYQERKELSDEEVLSDFGAAHATFKSTLLTVPPDKMSGQMTFAWGDRGAVSKMIEGMIFHEDEHRQEIERAVCPRA